MTADEDVRVFGGRYVKTRLLGEGGMGRAYLAFDQQLKREVVVKIPHERLLVEKNATIRFNREIRSLIKLEHPAIVKVFDAGRGGGVPFVVMQYVGGGSLEQRLERENTQTVSEVLEWLRPISEALDFIHENDFLHRDVKPGNILFDLQRNVFLADFGLARALFSSRSITTGILPGTPQYMAPEMRVPNEVGPAYDQYGLATTVFQALSKRMPFEAQSLQELMKLKARRLAYSPSRRVP